MIPNNSVGYVKPQVVINQVVVGGTMMINVQSHLHHMAMVVRKYEPYFTLQCFFRPQYIWGLSISMGLPRKILHFKSFQWAFPLLKPLLGYPPHMVPLSPPFRSQGRRFRSSCGRLGRSGSGSVSVRKRWKSLSRWPGDRDGVRIRQVLFSGRWGKSSCEDWRIDETWGPNKKRVVYPMDTNRMVLICFDVTPVVDDSGITCKWWQDGNLAPDLVLSKLCSREFWDVAKLLRHCLLETSRHCPRHHCKTGLPPSLSFQLQRHFAHVWTRSGLSELKLFTHISVGFFTHKCQQGKAIQRPCFLICSSSLALTGACTTSCAAFFPGTKFRPQPQEKVEFWVSQQSPSGRPFTGAKSSLENYFFVHWLLRLL